MTTVFVLGNGVSRQGIDLGQLQKHGQIYGCNALYREFVPNVLVATDRPIANKILSTGYARSNCFYTRRPEPDTGARALPPQYSSYSSGPNAVGLAALSGARKIFLLGFDLGPTANNTFNNVYADTEFYKTSAQPPTFTGNWCRQLTQIFNDFPDIQFVRVHGNTTAAVADFAQISNLQQIDLYNWRALGLDCS